MYQERIAILIDGGNFYRRLKELGIPTPGSRFSYATLIRQLARGRLVTSTTYYIGIVRNHDQSERGETLVQSQQKFLAGLEAEGVAIHRGRIVYDHKIREKGVDVAMAVDLIKGAVEDTYDTAVVVSSDTDLIPAIRYVQTRGKKVEYVGFAERPSLGLIRECLERRLLLTDELKGMDGEPEQEVA